MFRKAIGGLAMLTVGSYLWMGTSAGSYVRTAYNQTIGYVYGQVPVEFEIERAKQLASELAPDIQKAVRSIAEEEVKVARLSREIEKTRANLDGEKTAIIALKEQLGKGLTAYKVGSETFSQDAIKAELNRRFNSYRRVESTLAARTATLESRKTALINARTKYDLLLDARKRLDGEIAELEARHKMIEAAGVANRFVIDDSRLSQVRSLIDDINDRLTVDAKLTEEEGNLVKRVPVEEIAPADLDNQIDQYFGKGKATGTAL